jgi:hypothetical protein
MYSQHASDKKTNVQRAILVFLATPPRRVAIIVTTNAAKAVDAPNTPETARASINPRSKILGKSPGTQKTYSNRKTKEGKLKIATHNSQNRSLVIVAGVVCRSGERTGNPCKLLR